MFKRALLIAAVIVVTIGVAAVSAVWGRAEQEIGITEAPVISSNEIATDATSLRAVVKPDRLNAIISMLLNENATLPNWLPIGSTTALDALLPNEIALLGTPDYPAQKMRLIVFINERRGGVALKDSLNQAVFWQESPVAWQPGPFVLEERGRLLAKGDLPLPAGIDAKRRAQWPEPLKEAPLDIQGDHMFEVAMDNRAGDVYALITTLVQAGGYNWDQLRKANPQLEQAEELLQKAKTFQFAADIEGTDNLKMHFRIDATSEAESDFAIVPFVIPFVQEYMRTKYDMDLEGSGAWNSAEHAFIADFTLGGIERKLKEYLASMKLENTSATQPSTAAHPASGS